MKHPNNKTIKEMRDHKEIKYEFLLFECHIR